MNDNTYNGWTNRETWLINVWFNLETKEDVQMAKESFEEQVDALPPFLRDFISDDINWQELEDAMDDDEEEE